MLIKQIGRNKMNSWILHDELKEFDFSSGARYIYDCEYNLCDKYHVELLDSDSADAASCVESLGLSYDINARHYSTVIDGDRITDMVKVEWEFWKNE